MLSNRTKLFLYKNRAIRKPVQAYLLRNTPDCVFIWIPKTAGSSLFHWLHTHIGMRKMNRPWDYAAFPGYGATTFGHVHYMSLVYHGFVPQAYHDRAYKFAVVRDPYRRTASLFNYLRVEKKYPHEFATFLEEVRLHRPPVGLYNDRGVSQANPQVDWLLGWEGTFVTDELFRVEDMAAAMDALAKRFDVSAPTPLERRNTSPTSVDARDFDRETIEKINEIYARDFALLGYDMR